MAKQPDITTITTGYYSTTMLNNNFEALQSAFENTLSLDGSTPNAMQADLDLNGNDLINGVVRANKIYVNGRLASALTTAVNWKGPWVSGTEYFEYDVVSNNGSSYVALEDHTAGVTFSVDLSGGKWALLASKGNSGTGTGDLLAVNNLSDLDNAATALGNLGITATAAEINKLDGLTTTTEELNYVDGVTSSIQSQLDSKYETTTQNTTIWETGTETTESLVSPAKVKAAIDANSGNPVKAWVNFQGTGTVAINDSSPNVSSITDDGVGLYTVNLSTDITGVYAVLATASTSQVNRWVGAAGKDLTRSSTSTAIKIQTGYTGSGFSGGARFDYEEVSVSFVQEA